MNAFDKTTTQPANVHIGYNGYVDGSVEFYGDQIEVLTGYSREEFNSKKTKWTDLLPEEDTGDSREGNVRILIDINRVLSGEEIAALEKAA